MNHPERKSEAGSPARKAGSERLKGKPFQKGQSGNPGGQFKSGARRRKPSNLLRDMQLVYNQPEGKDRTAGQKALRKLFNDSPKTFLTQMSQLERAFSPSAEGSAKPAPPASPEPTDLGAERCIELCERLLDQWGAESLKENNLPGSLGS